MPFANPKIENVTLCEQILQSDLSAMSHVSIFVIFSIALSFGSDSAWHLYIIGEVTTVFREAYHNSMTKALREDYS